MEGNVNIYTPETQNNQSHYDKNNNSFNKIEEQVNRQNIPTEDKKEILLAENAIFLRKMELKELLVFGKNKILQCYTVNSYSRCDIN